MIWILEALSSATGFELLAEVRWYGAGAAAGAFHLVLVLAVAPVVIVGRTAATVAGGNCVECSQSHEQGNRHVGQLLPVRRTTEMRRKYHGLSVARGITFTPSSRVNAIFRR